jgi:hypothetical protein
MSNPTDVAFQDAAQVALYAPYCNGINRENMLDLALQLLARGQVSGQRHLRFGEPHFFVLIWQAGSSPLELSTCEMSFPRIPEVLYSFNVPTHQLVLWLMDLIQAKVDGGEPDLPENFWRWLLVGETPPT